MSYEIKKVEDFENLAQSKSVVLFHFWAEWNGTDYLMKRILSELETEFKNEVIFAFIDVDEKNLFEFFRSIPIVNVPTLIYYENGRRFSVDVGFNSKEPDKAKESIKSKLKELLSFNE